MSRTPASILLGIVLSQLQSSPPPALDGVLLGVMLLLAAAWPRARWALLGASGFIWGNLAALAWIDGRLPENLAGQDLIVVGVVRDLPQALPGRDRFDFEIERTEGRSLTGRVRLSWYSKRRPSVAPGDRWRFTVRLRPPGGLRNPGTFDYERWLYVRDVRAVGYVVAAHGSAIRASGAFTIDRLRANLADAIRHAAHPASVGALVRALAVGDRRDIGEDQWRVLRNTGTAHLVAISGLHIALAAGWAFAACSFLWRRFAWLTQRVPARRAAALAAVLAAATYTLLAGASVPTQRALIMTLVLAAGPLLGRNWLARDALAVAAAAVALLHPGSVLGAGFWMSFAAVTIILYVSGAWRRPARPPSWRARVVGACRLQMAIGLGLLPVTVSVFGATPLLAPLVNLVAIPVASVVVVPLVLTGTAALPLSEPAGVLLTGLAASAIGGAWPFLEVAAQAPVWVAPGERTPWVLAAAMVGAALLLAPRGVPFRWLGALWMLPILLLPPSRPAWGEIRVTMLDVGHGLSVVVETERRVLVYDAGSGGRQGIDIGSAVVVPFLASRGYSSVDKLVLSHTDHDHAGGFPSVSARMNVRAVIGDRAVAGPAGKPCRRGDRWEWDGVRFDVVHPAPGDGLRGNDRSCVILVQAAGGRLLLTGDVEARAEERLVERGGDRLRADVLVVPHHGSATSSTPAFIERVNPRIALVSAPRGGRRRLPAADVMARYRTRGIAVYVTGECGAVTLESGAGTALTVTAAARADARGFWQRGPVARAFSTGTVCRAAWRLRSNLD